MTNDFKVPEQVRERLQEIRQFTNVCELLDDAAQRSSTAPLINFFEEGLTLSAAELREQSMRLATYLKDLGVGLGTVVGVVLPNLPIFPIAWMALLRLGAIAVPMNTRYTADEYRFVIGDANISFVLGYKDFEEAIHRGADGLVEGSRRLIWRGHEATWLEVAGRAVQLPVEVASRWPVIHTDDVAGILYTSGTTGFPKGCVVAHRYWLTMSLTSQLVHDRPIRRILTDAPFFYIDAPAELILSLTTGAQQFVAKRPSLSKFTAWLVDLEIDFAEVWDALGDKVLDPISEERLRARGEQITAVTYGLNAVHQASLERRMNATVREHFGMTEIGLGMYQPVDDLACVGSGSCGVAAPLRETRIVDPESGSDVPDGVIGELWVRGPGIMLRYHNRLEVNQEVFRPGGWFRTGDLVLRDARGHHYVKGRIKDMVRRSHENIAAAEVEAALEQMDGVEAVGVIGVPDAFRGEEVKAFVVLSDGASSDDISPQALRDFGLLHLAAFKVPRYVEYVNALPMTPSGKISKRLLKKGEEGGPFGWDAETKIWRAR